MEGETEIPSSNLEPLPLNEAPDLRRISNLTEQYKDRLGEFEILPVGQAGFLVQSKKQLPMAGNDWFFFDYDDTLRGTSEVKSKRLELYKDYAQSQGIEVDDSLLEKIMADTDKFSRWEDTEGGGSTYHANTHLSALHWATEKLKASDADDQDKTIQEIDQTIQRIKGELDEETAPLADDPFLFRDKKFVLRSNIWFQNGQLTPWSKELGDLFMQTMINPPDYPETIQAVREVGGPRDSIHRTNIGVFTYGDPYYQLLKVFELMEKNPDLPINQLWLTRVPKGKFIDELIKTKATQKVDMQYAQPTLGGDSLEEDMSMGSGYPLGEFSHFIVIMDDNPKELNSIRSANELFAENTGAKFVVVRSRRNGTKESEKEWVMDTPYGEVDFRDKEFTGKDVALILQTNRYLSYKAQYGEESPRVQAMANTLRELGADEELLMAS